MGHRGGRQRAARRVASRARPRARRSRRRRRSPINATAERQRRHRAAGRRSSRTARRSAPTRRARTASTWSNVAAGHVHADGRRDRQRRRDDDVERRCTSRSGRRTCRRSVTITSPADGAAFTAPATIDGHAPRERQRRHRSRRSRSTRTARSIGTDTTRRSRVTWANVAAGSVHADGRRDRQPRRDDDVGRRARHGQRDPRPHATSRWRPTAASRSRRRPTAPNYPAVGRDQRRSQGPELGRGRRLERRHAERVAGLDRGRLQRPEDDRRSRRLLDAGQLQRAGRADADDDVHVLGLRAFEVQYWNGSAWVAVPGGAVTNNNQVWRQVVVRADDDVEDPRLHHGRAERLQPRDRGRGVGRRRGRQYSADRVDHGSDGRRLVRGAGQHRPSARRRATTTAP